MKVWRGLVERLVGTADIKIGGTRPWDVHVLDDRFYRRVVTEGTIGLGESYMDGWWECDAIDQMVERAQRANVAGRFTSKLSYLQAAEGKLRNRQSARRSFEVGRRHYDVGNDLYERMLDQRMNYSCGYWRDATDLDTAQVAKLDLVRHKLGLEPGMRVLDIGCGWGGAAQYFADTVGCEIVGVTVSERQAELAAERTRDLPVDIRLQDYRALDEKFDRIYSIGMFEHVGVRNYRTYLQFVRSSLADPDGIAVLHTIGGSRSTSTTDPWVERYIFPNSVLPSAAQITAAAEGRLVLEDWHNFGGDYDRTLMAWYANIESAWHELPDYDERFRRMWRFYLLSSAGTFRARNIHLWQVVFTRDGHPDVFRPDGIR